jgi:hypothetical protein
MSRGLLVFVMVGLVSGCNRAAPYLETARTQHAAMVEMKQILEGITDRESMESAKERLTDLMVRCQHNARAAQQLPRPSDGIVRQLAEEKVKLDRAMKDVQQEVRRVRDLPGGVELFQDIDTIIRGSS